MARTKRRVFVVWDLALASRRLSKTGLAGGQQPVTNEDRSINAGFKGELFNHVEERSRLEAQGLILHTHCDTDMLSHRWQENLQGMLERLREQFAMAVWDDRRR